MRSFERMNKKCVDKESQMTKTLIYFLQLYYYRYIGRIIDIYAF